MTCRSLVTVCRRSAVAAVLLAAIALPGCISVRTERVELPPQREIVGQVGAYSGAIRASRSISFSSERLGVLQTIAGKPDLEECDQLLLVRTVAGDDGFSSNKVEVVKALLNNPACTNRTRALVGDSITKLAEFSSHRREIAELLANPPARPAPPVGVPAR